MIGDASVGKTHLVQKYIKGYVPKNPIPTVGVEFGTKIIGLQTGQKVKAQIWDTSNQIVTQPARRSTEPLLCRN